MTDLAGPAVFSECGRYRYRLDRQWLIGSGRCAFFMLNPSTADDEKDDPTVRRCIRYATDWGYAGLIVLNVFGFRATDPMELRRAADPFGPDNEAVCRAAFALVDRVVVAWGNIGAYRFQHLAALAWIREAGLTPYCLGVTESGQPRHPLYCRANITPEEYVHD